MKRFAGLLGVLGVLLSTLMLMGTGPAFACSCVMASTAEHAERADLVFTGTVTSVERDRQTATYDVRVDRVFKGDLDNGDVEIGSSGQSTACGVDLPKSTEAVFFVTTEAEGLRMNACGGTTVATDTLKSEVSAALGDGAPAADALGSDGATIDKDVPAQTDNTALYIAVGLGIFALAAAALFGYALKRRPRA